MSTLGALWVPEENNQAWAGRGRCQASGLGEGMSDCTGEVGLEQVTESR